MAKGRVSRRLAAILAADVVGYSRLVEADEDGTRARFRALISELIKPKIAADGGHIVKTMGDGFLVEFPSAVDAVRSALEIQRVMGRRNADVPEDRRIVFRVGVNLGDVIVEDDDIHGEGVIVAARLESICAPGEVYVSGTVHDHVARKLEVNFEDLGDQSIKSVGRPVHVFRVAGVSNIADTRNANGKPLALPDKPSIAVLPFINISGDPEQEYFSDGMSEDVITSLSRFRSLFVIARNSSFSYKGNSSDVRAVARDLGVRYVLEGSIRKIGDRIRITGQLIDAASGSHIWAKRYDRTLEDIFAVQDEVTESIVAAIAPEISHAERDRAQRTPPDNLDTWGLYQRALSALYSVSTEDELASATAQFDRINEVDPNFAPAFAMAALARARYLQRFEYARRFDDSHQQELLRQMQEKAARGITLDPRDSTCLWTHGRVQSLLGRHDVAIAEVEEAIAQNPNDALAHFYYGLVLHASGRGEDSLSPIDHAIRLSPRDPHMPRILTYRSLVLFDLGRYEESFEDARLASLGPTSSSGALAISAAALAKLGRSEEAKKVLEDFLNQAPGISLGLLREKLWYGSPEGRKVFLEALLDAGMPE